jgi:hypothetical protein
LLIPAAIAFDRSALIAHNASHLELDDIIAHLMAGYLPSGLRCSCAGPVGPVRDCYDWRNYDERNMASTDAAHRLPPHDGQKAAPQQPVAVAYAKP